MMTQDEETIRESISNHVYTWWDITKAAVEIRVLDKKVKQQQLGVEEVEPKRRLRCSWKHIVATKTNQLSMKKTEKRVAAK